MPTTRRSNWGRWGPDDERGALNTIDSDVLKGAAAAITSGKSYSLGIPIQGQGVPLIDYRGVPMRLTLQDSTDAGVYAGLGCPEGTGAHEDVVVMASHTTSHMDALIHVYGDGKHYNGVDASEMRAMSGAGRLGIEKAGSFASRAVMLDFVAHFAADRWLEPGRPITAVDLEACAAAQDSPVRAGDIVCIRTGYLDMWNEMQPEVPFEQPGIESTAAEWLVDKDVCAVAADNAAVEVIPFDQGDFLRVHKILLVAAGIYMLEFLNFSELARDRCYEGLMAVCPLSVTGATGSPVNPVFVG